MIGKFYLFASLITIGVFNSDIFAQEICNRTAVINNQEVLVDLNSNSKGEGLRSYLQKDEVASSYLDDYQSSNKTQIKNAALGTFGAALVVGGLLYSDNEAKGLASREGLVGSGLGLIVLNYLMYKTIEFRNESKLERAIEEYNKRNIPKIYFIPYKEDQVNAKESSYGVFAGLSAGF